VEDIRQRPRRNRQSAVVRALFRETSLTVDHLIYPLFLESKPLLKTEISSMPGIYRWGEEVLLKEIEKCVALGIRAFVLFPAVPDELKDSSASYSWDKNNFYLKAIRRIKQHFPEVWLVSDVAMDPYSSDGHDGWVEDGKIINDKTLPVLGQMAVAQADAGIDMIGPSDMMDGRVGYLRTVLDQAGFQQTGILSYTAKYASAFYGPFRDALDSAPKSGDKKTYQMDYANRKEAIRELRLDEQEGADMVMVKPAWSYLDVIAEVKAHSTLPVAAYNVSGEYAMIKAAAANGWVDGTQAMEEMLVSIRRAGADVILTYFAPEYAALIQNRSRYI